MTNIVVPQLGESVVEARVARWLKKAGDRVVVGEPIVELETEKIDLEVPADKAGVVASIARQEGEDVKIGDVLGVIDESAAAAEPAGAKPQETSANTAAAPGSKAPAAAPARATATAKRMAKEHDVNLEAVEGSGTSGRVMKRDVENAMAPAAPIAPLAPTSEATIAPFAPTSEAKPASLAPTGEAKIPPTSVRPIAPARGAGRTETRQRMSKRRATIARRLVEAQRTAAMLTTFNEIDMTALMSLRERRKETFKKTHGVNLGISSFFVKAVVAALRAFPQINAEVQGDEIVLKHYYDIGMAVGAEGGLVVPVIRDTDGRSFAEIELAIRDFAQRAKDGTLTLEDLAGGTFTITNGGVFGSMLSTPILNPPQVGILGLHKIEDRAVPLGGQVVIRPMMYVALSYDHRIVDGREAVQFLVKVKEYIEDPGLLLIES
jgi:2-oxoglutarate dehydrogenase E2 component (dihydrolipoamide succinyltransferase)